MEFSTHPPEPFEFGKNIDDLASQIANPFRMALISMETLSGIADFNGEMRNVKLAFRDGRLFECEIPSLEPGDTFVDIPLPMRATKFQNELKKRSIATKKERGGVRLIDADVSFYIFEGEIATIRWAATNPQVSNPESPQKAN